MVANRIGRLDIWTVFGRDGRYGESWVIWTLIAYDMHAIQDVLHQGQGQWEDVAWGVSKLIAMPPWIRQREVVFGMIGFAACSAQTK